jgi:hypothetical protein
MTNLWPLFATINSIKIEGDAVDAIQSEQHDLTAPMMASARILYAEFVFPVIGVAADNELFFSFITVRYNCRDCWYSEWLHTPREDGRPRILVLNVDEVNDGSTHSPFHLIRHIKKVKKLQN